MKLEISFMLQSLLDLFVLHLLDVNYLQKLDFLLEFLVLYFLDMLLRKALTVLQCIKYSSYFQYVFSISDKPETNSLYPPVKRIDESPEIVFCRHASYSKSEEDSKLCPSGGYNFSQNATFEALRQDNIAVNTVTTNMAVSNFQINNN